MFKKAIFRLLFISIAMLATISVFAQGPEDPGEDPDIPIDGGISLLLAAGVAYGTKKLVDKRKADKNV